MPLPETREERRRSTAFYLWNLAHGTRNIAHYLPSALAHLHTFEQLAALPSPNEDLDSPPLLPTRMECPFCGAVWRPISVADAECCPSCLRDFPPLASPAPSSPEGEG